MSSPTLHPDADPWQATRAVTAMATRIMGADDYLGRTAPQVGALVAEGRYELFAACPPAEALQMQFELHPSAFIAVHDLGRHAAGRLVAEVAGGLKLPLQSLTIRRQGIGATLTTLQFLELPSPRGLPVRVYSADVESDAATRQRMAETLLAFSRLAVVLVGSSPPALTDLLAPLRARLRAMPWPNRQLLFLPTDAGTPDLADRVRELVADTAVSATTAAPASGAAAAWSRIQAAWDVVRGEGAPPGPAASAHPPSALPAREAGDDTAAAPGSSPLLRYAQACAALRGVDDVCLFRIVDRRPLAHAGRSREPQLLATQGASLLASALGTSAALGAQHTQLDIQVTLDSIVLLVRVLPQPHCLGMLTVGARDQVNPAALRTRLQRLEPLLRAR